MSNKLRPHFADAKGAIQLGLDGNIILAEGSSVPADATAGYAPGCIFFKRAGGALGGFYVNEGTALSSDFNLFSLGTVNLATLTATATELNRLDDDNAVLSTLGGTAITGSAETYKTSVLKAGSIYYTSILLDLTGLDAIATDGDIIGKSTNPAHLGRVTAARNGTPAGLLMTCLEAPAGASADIDLFRATVATGKLDDAMSGVTGQAVAITAGGSWTNGLAKGATAVPAADDYLYLANGAGANAGTYSAGKFLIEMWGY